MPWFGKLLGLTSKMTEPPQKNRSIIAEQIGSRQRAQQFLTAIPNLALVLVHKNYIYLRRL
jgi:hypothetical protein